jgi:thioredoxin-like negative regulator of GroEL
MIEFKVFYAKESVVCSTTNDFFPALEEAANNSNGMFGVSLVDISIEPDLAYDFDVKAVPTIVGVNSKGKVVGKLAGKAPTPQLLDFMRRVVKDSAP